MPPTLTAGLSLVLAVLLTGSMSFDPLPELTLFTMFTLVLVELAVGAIAGFILQMFLAVIIVGGEIIDMQVGMGMSKNFDPASNTSISATAGVFNTIFILNFFATNCHLTFIYLMAQTYSVVPLGTAMVSPALLTYLPNILSTILLLAVKLCLPLLIVEMLVTIAVGIVMRVVPQINIFVIHIQFKLLVGIFALVIIVAPLMAFFDNMMVMCLDTIKEAIGYFTRFA